MYDLIIEPEEEDAEWCWEEVAGALQSLSICGEGGCFPANAEGSVWVDTGDPENPGVVLIAVRAKEDRQVETIRRALDVAFSLAERLGGVVIDMQLGGRVLPENRSLIEAEFVR
jgi:hypothetical protein